MAIVNLMRHNHNYKNQQSIKRYKFTLIFLTDTYSSEFAAAFQHSLLFFIFLFFEKNNVAVSTTVKYARYSRLTDCFGQGPQGPTD